METVKFITLETFCQHYCVEVSFVYSLHDFDLIEISEENQVKYIAISQLAELEKIIRLHQDLEINTAGIDVVIGLLGQLKHLQDEIILLKSRLCVYE